MFRSKKAIKIAAFQKIKRISLKHEKVTLREVIIECGIEINRLPGRFFIAHGRNGAARSGSRENVHKRSRHLGARTADADGGQSHNGSCGGTLGAGTTCLGVLDRMRWNREEGLGLEVIGNGGSKLTLPRCIIKVWFLRGCATYLGSLDLAANHVANQVGVSLDKAHMVIRAFVGSVGKAVESVQIQLTLKRRILGLRKESNKEAQGLKKEYARVSVKRALFSRLEG